MNPEHQTNMNESPEMTSADPQRFSNRRWSLVLFLAVLVGIAQFGLGQFSAWVLAAPFVALLFMEMESTWKTGSGSQTLASAMASGGVLSQAAAALVFHGVVIGAVMTAASGAGDLHPNNSAPFVSAKPASAGGCGSGGMCGGGPATAALAKVASSGGCGSGGCGSSAGGCGSGGCGSSAGGCGSSCGASHAPTTPKPTASTPAARPYPLEIRPVTGVTNPPIGITPQAMAVISAQPQLTVPRPSQGPTMPPPPGVNATGASEGTRAPGARVPPPAVNQSAAQPGTASPAAPAPQPVAPTSPAPLVPVKP